MPYMCARVSEFDGVNKGWDVGRSSGAEAGQDVRAAEGRAGGQSKRMRVRPRRKPPCVRGEESNGCNVTATGDIASVATRPPRLSVRAVSAENGRRQAQPRGCPLAMRRPPLRMLHTAHTRRLLRMHVQRRGAAHRQCGHAQCSRGSQRYGIRLCGGAGDGDRGCRHICHNRPWSEPQPHPQRHLSTASLG